ncbi:hypothetical protein Q4Q39_20165 [Flavivirga amylovorans]|uniref:Uncharacterized protein n=1 Tax=Flavivirga amylovorans TaxID=870486 RepID=A0ABT8X7A3_9FLAO|nr:hypothetical protein [Flavivirga amylovorans]MDO5989727.1 hypothetical protein [Flavivirga amylovorans]
MSYRGFEPELYNEILNLEEKGLSEPVLAKVGYRSAEDVARFRLKVRKPFERLFVDI